MAYTKHTFNANEILTAEQLNDMAAEICVNLEDGTGTGAIQQKAESKYAEGFDFNSDNTKAIETDAGLASKVSYGATGKCATVFGGKASAQADRAFATGTGTVAAGAYSFAEGNGTLAYGSNSHSEGRITTAKGNHSHAEGEKTFAEGIAAHAEGSGTSAIGNVSHAEGNSTTASGAHSHAEGGGAQAIGDNSHAEGFQTKAYGSGAHAEGHGTEAGSAEIIYEYDADGHLKYDDDGNPKQIKYWAAHAEGSATKAYGVYSHAQNAGCEALGTASHASGSHSKSTGFGTHAMGVCVNTYEAYDELSKTEQEDVWGQTVVGIYNIGKRGTLFEVGNGTAEDKRSNAFEVYKDGLVMAGNRLQQKQEQESGVANGTFKFAGKNTNAAGLFNESNTGSLSAVKQSLIGPEGALSSGINIDGIPYGAVGEYAATLGGKSGAFGKRSVSEGTATIAWGEYSHSEGNSTVALGSNTHAEGRVTTAFGEHSHAEGELTIAYGKDSHAEGHNTVAYGDFSHAGGNYSKAIGKVSNASGEYTLAEYDYQTAIGKYNNNQENTLFEIGNGEDQNNLSNAFEVYKDGTIGISLGDGTGTVYSLQGILNTLINVLSGTSAGTQLMEALDNNIIHNQ